jgi:hypothetical protein
MVKEKRKPYWVGVKPPGFDAKTSGQLHAMVYGEPEEDIPKTQLNRIAWLSDEPTLRHLHAGLKTAGAIDAEWSTFWGQFEVSGEAARPHAACRNSWVRWLWTEDDLAFFFGALGKAGLIPVSPPKDPECPPMPKAWAATAADCFVQKDGKPFSAVVLRIVKDQDGRRIRHLQEIRRIVEACLRK